MRREADMQGQVAVASFFDNVINLAIEMVLLKDLHEVFSSSTVLSMDSSQLSFVASEPLNEQQHRLRVSDRLKKLEAAKQVCDDYRHGISDREYLDTCKKKRC